MHCGDFTNFGTMPEVRLFCEWLQKQPYKHKIVVPGNHDIIMDAGYFRTNWKNWNASVPDAAAAAAAAASAVAALRHVATVLIDESVVVAGVRIHGSPWVETYALPALPALIFVTTRQGMARGALDSTAATAS